MISFVIAASLLAAPAPAAPDWKTLAGGDSRWSFKCAQGDLADCATLSGALLTGNGVPLDIPRAELLGIATCEKGNGRGCSTVASIYQQGLGGKAADPSAATGWFTKACLAPSSPVQTDCLLASGTLRRGSGQVAADPRLAGELDARRAELLEQEKRRPRPVVRLGARVLARSRAQCSAGNQHHCAAVASDLLRQDDLVAQREGEDLARKACDAGNGRGCFQIAFMYRRERAGHAGEVAAAQAWDERACLAAEDADPTSCEFAASAYRFGISAEKDPAKAATFYERECTLGGPKASCASAGALRNEQPAPGPAGR